MRGQRGDVRGEWGGPPRGSDPRPRRAIGRLRRHDGCPHGSTSLFPSQPRHDSRLSLAQTNTPRFAPGANLPFPYNPPKTPTLTPDSGVPNRTREGTPGFLRQVRRRVKAAERRRGALTRRVAIVQPGPRSLLRSDHGCHVGPCGAFRRRGFQSRPPRGPYTNALAGAWSTIRWTHR